MIGNDQVDFFELSFEEIKGWFMPVNQEDSVILNKASIERGMFMTTAYKVLVFEEKKKTNCSYEKIEIPPLKSQNKTMNYSKLGPDGIVKKGVPVYKGDIIVGKTLTKVQKEDEEKNDCSLAISSGEEGVIDDIWKGVCEEGYVMIKVKIRQLRFPEVGDKCACFTDQTSVLTVGGWKNIKDILTTDRVATLQNNKIIYDYPLKTFEYDYEGKMYHLETENLDMTITPNHKLYIKYEDKKEFELVKVEEVFGTTVYHKKNGDYNCDKNYYKNLIETLISFNKDYITLEFAENIQKLSICAGWSVDIEKYKNQYKIHINKTEKENEVLSDIQKEKWIDYIGKVYCIEVPGNIFYVKQNGKTYWSGNSRSSQKGVCGLLLPQEDMPFTSQGITPDLLMNPHSLPSRMTLSQLIECLYSKTGSLDGKFGDATAFTDQSIDPVEWIADMLKKHGFQKYGNEKMFNGFTGEFLDSEIFIGPTYYQRLKHMVQDKIHCLTLDHEVLTFYGWKMIGEIKKNDLVATLNKDGYLEYQYPINIYDYPEYEGSMYSIKNKMVDLLVTGNHRMWVSQDKKIYDFMLAKDVFSKNMFYKNDALLEKEAYPVENELLIILGIWITYKILCLPKELKNMFLYCLDKLKIEYNYDKRKDIFEIKQNQFNIDNNDNLLPQWIFDLNHNQSKLLIHIIFNNKHLYHTKSKKLADQIQQLCLHAGFSCIIMKKYKMYRLDKSIIHNNDSEETYLNNKKIHVACIEVPNQIFYVRRNGKPVWTGNSRATGNVTMMHHQPSEGRSREGGLRVGEMERDALISHGGAAFIQETLFDMSDQYQVNVCETCGNILSSSIACRICKNGQVNRTNIPYCAKLLFQELEAMGIKIQINTK